MKQPISHILSAIAQLPKNKQADALSTHPQAHLLAGFLNLAVNKNVKWLLPEGAPPFNVSNLNEWSILIKETRRMNIFIEGGGYDNIAQNKRERVFIEILEAVHADDAKLLLLLKEKKVPEGLDLKQIEKAFPGITGGE